MAFGFHLAFPSTSSLPTCVDRSVAGELCSSTPKAFFGRVITVLPRLIAVHPPGHLGEQPTPAHSTLPAPRAKGWDRVQDAQAQGTARDQSSCSSVWHTRVQTHLTITRTELPALHFHPVSQLHSLLQEPHGWEPEPALAFSALSCLPSFLPTFLGLAGCDRLNTVVYCFCFPI